MKKLVNVLLIASFSIAGCYSSGQIAQPGNYNYSDNYNNYNNADISYQTFYDQLQPYGNWINYPEYGNVWQPSIGSGFRPYETGGHWVSTVDGWAWASDYNWGWAPFHYGRWFFDPSIGWAWTPGYEWAPAWVTWGEYNNYYAWAPLAPGINISFGNTWHAPSNYWSFVPRSCINYSNLNRYVARNYNTNVNNITIINNYNSYNQKDYYHRGPDYQEVQRYTHKAITPLAIASTNRPGSARISNKEFQVFRPSVLANGVNNNSAGQTAMPNRGRIYNGGTRENPQTGTNINVPDNNTIRRNPTLNDVRAGGNRDGISNGVTNGSNINQQDIDNTNRRLQDQQMERIRNAKIQATENKRPDNSIYQSPPIQQIPQNNQPNTQPGDQRQPVIRNYSPADNVQPVRPQNNFPADRIMQRPQQNERIMRPPQAPPMPNRMENRGSNAGRSIQMERSGNQFRRP